MKDSKELFELLEERSRLSRVSKTLLNEMLHTRAGSPNRIRFEDQLETALREFDEVCADIEALGFLSGHLYAGEGL